MASSFLRRLLPKPSLKHINWWPPFRGAGIHIKYLNDEFTSIEVELRSYFWNRNYVGTHFGGSLYAMTDPFYMLILMKSLGPNYIVWDKSASIRFKIPGKGTVRARFEMTPEEIASVRETADREEKAEPTFRVQIFDEENRVIAEVDKVVSVRRKDKPRKPR